MSARRAVADVNLVLRYAADVTRSLAVCGFLLSLLPLCWADQTCSRDTVRHSAAEVKAIQAQLMAVKLEPTDSGVSPAMQQQIRAIKDALAATVDAYMHCEPGNELNAKQVQDELASLLNANNPDNPSQYTAENMPQVDQVYGADLKVAVNRPEKEPQLLAIKLSFGIRGLVPIATEVF